jgi:hypothetical protein
VDDQVPDETIEPVEQEPRRIPSTFGGMVYLVVVAATIVGVGIVAFGPWRRGIALIGIALILGAVMRLALPERDAGMLRVRHRFSDVLMLAGVGTALIVLANVIPNQPV